MTWIPILILTAVLVRPPKRSEQLHRTVCDRVTVKPIGFVTKDLIICSQNSLNSCRCCVVADTTNRYDDDTTIDQPEIVYIYNTITYERKEHLMQCHP